MKQSIILKILSHFRYLCSQEDIVIEKTKRKKEKEIKRQI